MSEPDMQALEQERSRQREEENANSAATQTAIRDALEEMDGSPSEFLKELGKADFISDDNKEYQDARDLLDADLSAVHARTYHAEDERQNIDLAAMAKAERIILEREHGDLCTGPFLEIAQETSGRDYKSMKPRFTADEKRVIRTGIREIKTSLQKLSIDHVGLDKAADTHIESQVRRVGDDSNSSGGALSRVTNKLFG